MSRAPIEWVGGFISIPSYVTEEGEPYRPEVLVWLGETGAILGSTMGRPGDTIEVAGASLREAIERPVWGDPQRPERVRVASPELAAALRAAYRDIEVVCAPTPELDEVADGLRKHIARGGEVEASYLSKAIGPDAMGALFRAAAGLFRARPWKTVPDDDCLFAVTIEALGVRDAVLIVIGQIGESFGFLSFWSFADFVAFLEAAEAHEHGENAPIPPYLALTFERGADLDAGLRKEIAEHGWEVASANAYPSLIALELDRIARPPSARELIIAEALALALPEVLTAKTALVAAWNGGEAVSRSVAVGTHAGDLEVTLRAPHPEEPPRPQAKARAPRPKKARRKATRKARPKKPPP
jgi:hypothetical protein